MLERLQDLPPGIDGVKAVGKVSREDYEQVLEPILDDARRDGRQLRFLYQFGPEFESFTPSAAWEDAKVGLRSLRLFDGCAIVTDVVWLGESTRLAAFLMPCPVKIFSNAARAEAVEWLRSLPEHDAITHRLLPGSGVIVVEVREALRAHDFDALSTTADAWIEAHGALQGLVIHAGRFPGWENLGGLFRHVKFVRDHHRKVKRIALAVDDKLATLVPLAAAHFVDAEIKSFNSGQLDAAIAWAGGPAEQSVGTFNASGRRSGAEDQKG